jgi:hypothetical protein
VLHHVAHLSCPVRGGGGGGRLVVVVGL